MGQQLNLQHPERLVHFLTIRINLAILKFSNCAKEEQIIKEVQDNSEARIKASSIQSCLCELVDCGHVMRVEDLPEHQSNDLNVFYILSPSGYEQMKSKIWMIDNMNPVDTVWFMD